MARWRRDSNPVAVRGGSAFVTNPLDIAEMMAEVMEEGVATVMVVVDVEVFGGRGGDGSGYQGGHRGRTAATG